MSSSSRRFLTFPAINPCSSVSPSALLADLSSLASSIDSFSRCHPSTFPTHRRSSRESLRYASILLPFLQDLLPSSSSLSRSSLLALSDLHVTLQKLRLLLSDCARPGARLLILLNATRIAGEFTLLLRSVAVSLEFVPLDSLHLSPEIKDLVRLLVRQARRLELGVERADELAGRSVRSMLDQFRAGESPDPNDLRRVLNHLRIASWVDCFAEVSFLEEEIFAAAEEERNGEAALLWGAMGLMVYSLVAMFDEKGAPDGKRRGVEGRREPIEKLNGDDLRCPISLELMRDPVTVSTGQTYDRSSILRWLKAGNQTCPVTGETLACADLVPNSAVRELISLYCRENGILVSGQGKTRKRDLGKTLSPASAAAVGAIRMAATVLVGKLAVGESREKSVAAYEMRMLSKSNIFNRMCLVEAGAVKWLLCVLSSCSSDSSLQDNAVAALLNLSKHHSGRTDIFEAGGLPAVVQVMRFGQKVEAQKNAAAVLFYLSAMEVCREAVGEIPEAIPALVELLKNGTYRGKKNAIVTIYGLLLFSGNQAKILAADTVAVIADLLEAEEEEDLVTDCVGVLAKIAERTDGTNEILKSCVLGHLVHVLRSSSSSSGREYCVSVLLSVCKNGGGKAMSLFEKMPLLMPSLYSLLSDGSRQASKKARTLLNYIHQFNDQRYSPVMAVHDPVVHVL